jgi:hypothetical protein
MEKPASTQSALPGRIAAKDRLAQLHIEEVMQRRKRVSLYHNSCIRSCNMKGEAYGVVDGLLLRIEKGICVYHPLSYIGLKVTAKGLKLMLQLMHQRDTIVGYLCNILSNEKRCHCGAVFERLVLCNPIFRVPKVHSQRESQFGKAHMGSSSHKIDYYFIFIY